MTVGKRIGLGFSMIILITVIIGGMGVSNMLSAKTDSTMLASEYVPEVKVATDLRGAANRLMYQMRGYGLTENHQYYEEAGKELENINTHLDEADDLAQRAEHLQALKGQVTDAKAAVKTYSDLMQQTEETINKIAAQRTILDKNAASYMKNCADFLAGQNAAFKKDLKERQTKIDLATAIVHRGTRTRVTNFKAQSENDMAMMAEAMSTIQGLDNELQQLRPITRATNNIEQMDEIESAAKAYAQAMGKYIETSRSLAEAEESMNKNAAAYMKNCSDFLDSQNEAMTSEFNKSGANLDERLQKITLVNDVIEMGNTARITNFKAQATDDMDLMRQAVAQVQSIPDKTAQLRKITRKAENIKQIDVVEEAAAKYASGIEQYLQGSQRLVTYRDQMDSAAKRYVQNCDAFLNSQQEQLTKDMHERHDKISLVNSIVNLGNDARIKAFKAQATSDMSFIQGALANFSTLDEKYAELRKITRLDADLERIDNTQASGNNYATALRGFLQEWGHLHELAGKREEAGRQVITACKTTADAGMTNTDKIASAAADSLSRSSTIMIGGLILGTIIAVVSAIWIARSITGRLTRIIAGLNEGADQVNDAAAQVSSASQQLAEGASEQASSLEQTSSALEEMAAMTRTNANNATEANTLSGQAREAAHRGDQTMERLNGAMTAINDSSGQISKIIKVIEEIAFQTNLLALNAAVEAARAGEHGKGFAVVADEVRNLAQRCAQAARETTGLIEDSVNKAKEGAEVASEVGNALGAIVGDVTKVTDLINGIAQASQEQAQGVDQVNIAVSQMDKVTQQNASGAEESASAAEELSAQAATVKSMVDELSMMVGGSEERNRPMAGGSSSGASSKPKLGGSKIKRSAEMVTATSSTGVGTGGSRGHGSPDEEFLSMDDQGLSDF